MSLEEQLLTHWDAHLEAAALYSVKECLTKTRNFIKANLGKVAILLSGDALENLHEDVLAEIQEIQSILARSDAALDDQSDFLDWTPPN